jgi:sorbitol-specific phosphotransferase system component IIC
VVNNLLPLVKLLLTHLPLHTTNPGFYLPKPHFYDAHSHAKPNCCIPHNYHINIQMFNSLNVVLYRKRSPIHLHCLSLFLLGLSTLFVKTHITHWIRLILNARRQTPQSKEYTHVDLPYKYPQKPQHALSHTSHDRHHKETSAVPGPHPTY